VVHQFFPYYPTGVERNTQNLAAQMRRMGHSTVVLSAIPQWVDETAASERYFYKGTEVLQFSAPRVKSAVPDYEEDKQTIEILDRVINDTRPDVVHLMHPRYYPEAISFARRVGIPCVVHLHDYWYCCPRIQMVRSNSDLCTSCGYGLNCEEFCGMPPGAGSSRYQWSVATLGQASAVVSPSQFLIDVFKSQGFDTSSWNLIPYGVDYRSLGLAGESAPPEGGPLVIRFLGTLLRHKGPDVLIRAVKMAEGAKIEAKIHGSSFHESDYESELRSLAGDDERISFEGPYDYEDLGKILSDTDLVVVPSLWYENLPITALTAIGLGVPVIASRLGGMREIVETYKGGLLFPPGDAESLAKIISDLSADRERLFDLRRTLEYPPSVEEEAHKIDLVYSAVTHNRG
jgi:glycosyltransferase involved in cell wall biosynthesis